MSVVASKLFSYFTISPVYPHERNYLPEIVEKYNTKVTLSCLGYQPELVNSVDEGKAIFLPLFVTEFRSTLAKPDVQEKIDKLKLFRNKRIAHNEAAEITAPTWEALKELVSIAQNFVGVIGWAFFSTVYVHNGEYFLTSDAKRASRALDRLAKSLVEDK